MQLKIIRNVHKMSSSLVNDAAIDSDYDYDDIVDTNSLHLTDSMCPQVAAAALGVPVVRDFGDAEEMFDVSDDVDEESCNGGEKSNAVAAGRLGSSDGLTDSDRISTEDLCSTPTTILAGGDVIDASLRSA